MRTLSTPQSAESTDNSRTTASNNPTSTRHTSRQSNRTEELPSDLRRIIPVESRTMEKQGGQQGQQGQQGSINFDDLRRTIEATVNSAVNRALEGITSNSGPPGPPRPPGPPGEPSLTAASNGSTNMPAFMVRDVGYFDPNSDTEPVEIKEMHQVYHNVFTFTNRLKAKAVTMDATLLRNNLTSCLTGEAKRWYTEEISHITRIGLQNTGINEWCDLLEQRFRDPPSRSLAALEQERYTVTDVRKRREPAKYVQSVVLLGRDAGIATTRPSKAPRSRPHLQRQGHLPHRPHHHHHYHLHPPNHRRPGRQEADHAVYG